MLIELREQTTKVERFRSIYQRMHGGIVAHPVRLAAENLERLEGIAFANASDRRTAAAIKASMPTITGRSS